MFGFDMLDVLIGLVTIYLVFGIACTAIVEAVANVRKVRSQNLEKALRELLDGDLEEGKPFLQAFYDHPLIQSLSKGQGGRPSYIPKELVSRVVESLVLAKQADSTASELVAALPGTPQSNRIKGILTAHLTLAHAETASFRQSLEGHFDAVMERASGWYKRYTQTITYIAATALVLFGNVDTLQITKQLAANPEARAALVEVAQKQVATATQALTEASADVGHADVGITLDELKQGLENAQAQYGVAVATLQAGSLQFGWDTAAIAAAWGQWWDHTPGVCDKGLALLEGIPALLFKLAGLAISIFAISLGAPFWFDVLQKFMRVRESLKPGESQPAARTPSATPAAPPPQTPPA